MMAVSSASLPSSMMASRECLAQLVARRIRSGDVLAILAELFVIHGPPAHIRSDDGPEFIAIAVKEWLAQVGVQTLYITPGSPWENGYCESFNASLHDERLNGEIFHSLTEAQILIDLNAKQATIRAGYSKNVAAEIGCKNLTKPHVAAAIKTLIEAQSATTMELQRTTCAIPPHSRLTGPIELNGWK